MIDGSGIVLAEMFAALRPHLNERQRRLALGAAARALGLGGIRSVAAMTGAAESTVSRGVRELESGAEPLERVRAAGAGRRRRRDDDPGLVDALMALVEPDQRGDPEAAQPLVSVDTKKKEVLGDYAVPGREWHRAGQPVRVREHDFPDKDAPKAVPYGVYDLAADAGWVAVGCDGDTAAFAVATLRRWW